MDFAIGIILLFAVGSCAVKDACRPDKSGNTYKWCGKIFEKENNQQTLGSEK